MVYIEGVFGIHFGDFGDDFGGLGVDFRAKGVDCCALLCATWEMGQRASSKNLRVTSTGFPRAVLGSREGVGEG